MQLGDLVFEFLSHAVWWLEYAECIQMPMQIMMGMKILNKLFMTSKINFQSFQRVQNTILESAISSQHILKLFKKFEILLPPNFFQTEILASKIPDFCLKKFLRLNFAESEKIF